MLNSLFSPPHRVVDEDRRKANSRHAPTQGEDQTDAMRILRYKRRDQASLRGRDDNN
jgi:hypothetical protein